MVFKSKVYINFLFLFYLVLGFKPKVIYKSMIDLSNCKSNNTIRLLAPQNLGVDTYIMSVAVLEVKIKEKM